jgi:hypothetical protein
VYAHRGYLFRIRVEDFDKDGMPEVFMGGTANCDRQPLNQDAAFVVLDSDHFSGWPGDGAFEGSGRAAFDSCRARILFPPIREHCLLLGSPGYHVSNYFVRPSEADPGVMVCIGWSAPGLIVSLDRDFQPVRVVAEDDLRPVVEKALAAGLIAEDFTRPERLERYLAEVKRVR